MNFRDIILNETIKVETPKYIISESSYIKSISGNYERGIDNIKPGLMFLLQFTSFTDNEYITDKDDYKKITNDLLKNSAKMPAIILSKSYMNDGWPVYDIMMQTKSNAGESSGAIIIKDICVWRYFGGKKTCWEGIPPNWFIKYWETQKEIEINQQIFDNYQITPNDLFYIKDNKEIQISRK